jgi:hypothetical protein
LYRRRAGRVATAARTGAPRHHHGVLVGSHHGAHQRILPRRQVQVRAVRALAGRRGDVENHLQTSVGVGARQKWEWDIDPNASGGQAGGGGEVEGRRQHPVRRDEKRTKPPPLPSRDTPTQAAGLTQQARTENEGGAGTAQETHAPRRTEQPGPRQRQRPACRCSRLCTCPTHGNKRVTRAHQALARDSNADTPSLAWRVGDHSSGSAAQGSVRGWWGGGGGWGEEGGGRRVCSGAARMATHLALGLGGYGAQLPAVTPGLLFWPSAFGFSQHAPPVAVAVASRFWKLHVEPAT